MSTSSILRPAPMPSKAARLPRIRCATCERGSVEIVGQSCADCWALERRERAIRARHHRAEIIGRLAHVAGCQPAELVELFADIALQAQEAARG